MAIVAVVPIFFSAGAAALPTIIAAVGSVAAIALKPRALFRLCWTRPLAAGSIAVGAALLLTLLTWGVRASEGGRATAKTPTSPSRYDWSKVALQLIAMQQAGKTPTALDDEAPLSNAIFLGRDAARSSCAGVVSPVRLRSLWQYLPEDGMFLSQPLVTRDRIFTAANQSDLGGYTGLLACVDANTGQPLWQVTQFGDDPSKPYFSSPALTQDGKYLIIGQGLHQDRDCSLLCYEADTGKPHWSVKTTLHIESSPTIFGDMVVVGAGAIEGDDGLAIGDPGYVIAVQISTGKLLWRQPVNDPESTPAIDEQGIAYIGSGFNGLALVALRPDSDDALKQKKLNRILWRTATSYPITSPITLAADLVIAGGGNSDMVHSNANPKGGVIAIDRKTGSMKWEAPFDDAVIGAIAARDGVLICPCRTGEVVALSQDDGRVLWRTRVSGNAPVLAGCAFTGTHVYAVSNDGYLAVIDAKTGAMIEKFYLNDSAKAGSGLSISPPQVFDGRIIVGSETGGLHCLIGGTNP